MFSLCLSVKGGGGAARGTYPTMHCKTFPQCGPIPTTPPVPYTTPLYQTPPPLPTPPHPPPHFFFLIYFFLGKFFLEFFFCEFFFFLKKAGGAGGMPLAVTQEDCLVKLNVHFIYLHWFVEDVQDHYSVEKEHQSDYLPVV